MIAAAAAPTATHGMPFNWFDIAAVVVLGFGIFRGRRNGMSKELLPLVQWLVLVSVSGLVYPKLAGVLARFVPDKFWTCLLSYLALAMVVFIVFAIIRQQIAEKLVARDFFKGGEYYLGMMAGVVRYACVLIFVLALMNAPVYSAADIAKAKAYNARWFGGGEQGYTGNFFPTLQQIQEQTFKESFLGPRIKDNLGMLLINTGQSGADAAKPGPSAPAPPKSSR